jgi:hypothetical protein
LPLSILHHAHVQPTGHTAPAPAASVPEGELRGLQLLIEQLPRGHDQQENQRPHRADEHRQKREQRNAAGGAGAGHAAGRVASYE